MKTIVAILAGGTGSRFNSDIPKQFCEYKGKKLIELTIEKFNSHPLVDEIIVAVSPDFESVISEIKVKNSFSKIIKIVNSGAQRYNSSLSVLNSCNYDEANILIHDAARPFLSNNLITRVITALNNNRAVSVGISCVDTIMEINNDGYITKIPNRNSLRRVQTPQAFKLSVIKKAYDIALQDKNIVATDDCGIVLKYMPEIEVYVVEGEEQNIKVTYQSDLD